MKALRTILTHGVAMLVGIALGIYLLPLLTETPAPSSATMALVQAEAQYVAQFERERTDSDLLHWGEGQLLLGEGSIGFRGELAPGPDYRLYLSPRFVETEHEFLALQGEMVAIGSISSFDGFALPVPNGVEVGSYQAAIVWCESFQQFITSGVIRPRQSD
ncbi:DM13 domain-containing protein [Ferrimonas lipolytica]|uniref:DM13 domain-containing protein n=1 Tax=Ferrimonas lipolytica TaxID=2724191 RepID=A0A6H1UFL6_9GAMM|nr:DM13 domain-containing protein [Ferrimonas lipolytica]QIZ77897.1 DM13 domain-containing protein [Ferrimonas lipolytica]